jgi:predicted DNA-binding transcriptional regulator YafY
MMFTDEEAQAVSLGLIAARELGLSGMAPAIESAQAKLSRVMPEDLRAASESLRDTIALQVPAAIATDAHLLRELARAAQAGRTVTLHYRAADGVESRRGFDAYGLVFRGARWYLIGHCQLRNGLRTLRLDRIVGLQPTPFRFTRPRDFDPAAYLSEAMRNVPRAYAFTVHLEADLARAREVCFWLPGELEPIEGGVVLTGSTDDLHWTARQLVALPLRATVREPAALRAAMAAIALELAKRYADQ